MRDDSFSLRGVMKSKQVDMLESQMDSFLEELASVRQVAHVPRKDDCAACAGGLSVECTALFADLGGSTALVDRYDRIFSSWVLKSYLSCAAHVIRSNGGVIGAFEGDGLMGLFCGQDKDERAVRCAFQIQWATGNIIQKRADALFADREYTISQVVGVDSSELMAIRTDIWRHYDVLWVGRAANYAANLTRIRNDRFSTYITEAVHSGLPEGMRGPSGEGMWERMPCCDVVGGIDVFRSGRAIPI